MLQANDGGENFEKSPVREDKDMESDKSDSDDLFKMFLKSKPADTTPDKEMKTDFVARPEDDPMPAPDISPSKDEMDIAIEELTTQLQLCNLPNPGNLRSSKRKDVKMRVRCIQALFKQRLRD